MRDKDRILRRLRSHGSTTPLEWQGPDVIDGGKPILRPAARVGDLRKDGIPVETARTRPCALYVLPTAATVVEPSGQYALTEQAA
jgi:hypothetical protein